MAPAKATALPVAPDHAVLQARIDAAVAQQETRVRAWMDRYGRPRPPPRSAADLAAEDAELHRLEPPYLGLGAAIPQDFLAGDVPRRDLAANEKLRRMLVGKTTVAGQKPRDHASTTSTTASARPAADRSHAKRARRDDSSDEDEGRSALGRAKKTAAARAAGADSATDAAAADADALTTPTPTADEVEDADKEKRKEARRQKKKKQRQRKATGKDTDG